MEIWVGWVGGRPMGSHPIKPFAGGLAGNRTEMWPYVPKADLSVVGQCSLALGGGAKRPMEVEVGPVGPLATGRP